MDSGLVVYILNILHQNKYFLNLMLNELFLFFIKIITLHINLESYSKFPLQEQIPIVLLSFELVGLNLKVNTHKISSSTFLQQEKRNLHKIEMKSGLVVSIWFFLLLLIFLLDKLDQPNNTNIQQRDLAYRWMLLM